MAETATKKTETVKSEEKKQEEKKPATKTAAAKESAKKEETKAEKKETKPAAAKKDEKKDSTPVIKQKEADPVKPAEKIEESVNEDVDAEPSGSISKNEEAEHVNETPKAVEKSEEIKEEKTMFELSLPRRIAMYMHPTYNAACRMIEGTVICKSDKDTNGWLTVYTGVPEIGKVTGFIRKESLGWR